MPIIRWRSLRTRIILLSFVPAVIILMAVAYVTFYAYQNVTEDLVVQRNQEVARLSASQLGTGLTDYVDLLNGIAHTLGLAADDPAARRRILEEASNRLVVFDGGLAVLDSFGTVRDTQPARPEIMDRTWSDRPYFRQLFRTRSPVFSDIISDGPGGTDAVVVAVPINGPRGEFAGALTGMFKLNATAVSAFYGGILKLRLADSGNFYLVDENGRVIYHTDSGRIGTDISSQEAVKELLSRGSGSLRARDADGQDIVAGFARIPGTPWGLVTEESRAALLKPSEGPRRFLIILIVLGVVVPTLFVTFAVGRIMQPIADLTGAAREITAGNFGQTINPGTGDELEGLAAQFNTMSAQLQESYSTLERRVAARTQELTTLNAIAAVANRSLDIDEILHDALAQTTTLAGYDAGVAYQLDEDSPAGVPEQGHYLTLRAYRGISEEAAQEASHLLMSDSAAGAAVQTLQPTRRLVSDYPDSRLKRLIQSEGIQMVVSIPLTAKNRVLGVINLGARDSHTLRPEEMSLLAAIGQQIGMAMENAHLYEKAEEAAAAAERSRLARDLHDAVTQTLFSASLIAEVLPKLWDRNPAEGRRRLEELRQLTRGALAEMRTLLLELRPTALTEAPLSDLLRQLGESVTGRARVPVTVTIQGDGADTGHSMQGDKPRDGLPPDVKVGLYRIAQEALNNVAKHAMASRATVTLSYYSGCVALNISDDGQGFDLSKVPPDHLGLGIMRERAEAIGAIVNIESEPGNGTSIDITWSRPGVEQPQPQIAKGKPATTG